MPLAWAEREVLSRLASTSAPFVLIIDGRSGSGKTSLARMLASHPAAGDCQVLAMDTIYPGWDGLSAGTRLLERDVLPAFRSNLVPDVSRWDWERDVPGEPVLLDPGRSLIVEGAGALTGKTAATADVTVWLDSPESSRRPRALERDGDAYLGHWEQWARQEEAHIAQHAPAHLAALVVRVP